MYSNELYNHGDPSPAAPASFDKPVQRGLSRDQELQIAALIAHGDQAARNRMVTANLGLVVTIARRFQGRGLALEDLVGEGNLGLIRATECFDPKFGTRFKTYASYWIEEAIRDALINRTAMIRLPAYIIGLLTKWDRTSRLLHQKREFPPTFDEVASHLGLTEREKKLVQTAQCSLKRKSAKRMEGLDDNSTLCEPVDTGPGPDDRIRSLEEREKLESGMRCLDEREQRILESRFGFGGEMPSTLREVGEHMGLTREWVSKIEKRAIKKLGSLLNASESSLLQSKALA